MENNVVVEIVSSERVADIEFEKSIYNLEQQIERISSDAETLDYLVAMSSGLLCSMMDILWVGEFDLQKSREISDEDIKNFVKKIAKIFGCKNDSIEGSVSYLEKLFPIAADGNTSDFGGGRQHHLRDFAHHPTIVGLIFSLLTQFTSKSCGTDTLGNFIVVSVPEKSKIFIGEDIPDKIIKGSIIWFFHLVSDMAGSSSTVATSGGTGIPGPILALAKELSIFPFIKELKVGDGSISQFISKLFNGTFFAKYDEHGKIIKDTVVKFDLRGELAFAYEIGMQAVPVIANECLVRVFYFIRQFVKQIKLNDINSLKDISTLDWDKIKPHASPTLTRMLLVSTSIFTTIDITEAFVTKKYWVSINYIGVGRFTLALGQETVCCLKVRELKKIKQLYEEIKRNAYTKNDNDTYERLGDTMDINKFGLNLEQTEILYNIERQKVLNDIDNTKILINNEAIIALKKHWLNEWQEYMNMGYSFFVDVDGAELKWYDKEELLKKVAENEPEKPWLRLLMLEAMLFEPYYALTLVKNKKGEDKPSKKYKDLENIINGFNKTEGDKYLDEYFADMYFGTGYVKRLRKSYEKAKQELNEVLKTAIVTISITAGVTILALLTAGIAAPKIAILLVGAKFVGLHGAALTSACLAFLGGGAISAGGFGMAGGVVAIVGGGSILGLGVGAGVGGAVSAVRLIEEKQIIMQSAKLIVSYREIFLNDEKDTAYSTAIFEQYVKEVEALSKCVAELKIKADLASKDEKKDLKKQIKHLEKSIKAMRIAMKNMNKFKSSFEEGLKAEE